MVLRKIKQKLVGISDTHLGKRRALAIRIHKAGTLKNLLPSYHVEGVEELILSGVVNDADLSHLRDLIERGEGRNLKKVDLSNVFVRALAGEGVLPNYAFYNCPRLESIILPVDTVEIGDGAFENCRALPSIRIPAACLRVSPQAFDQCNALKHVFVESENAALCDVDGVLFDKRCETFLFCPPRRHHLVLPATVRSIAPQAFRAESITRLVCMAPVPPRLEADSMQGIDKRNCSLYVPREYLDVYRETPAWADFYKVSPLHA